jgi:ribonuclease M5
MKPRIKEIIVVEGRYDRNTLSQIVDASIIVTGGFSIFHDAEKLALLRRLAERRGLIVLTDSDGAGFVIRNYLKGAIPNEQLKQAYIPDMAGKEHRKKSPGKEHKIGVEGMQPDVLLSVLRKAGATFEGESVRQKSAGITKADLLDRGLIGPGSTEKRRELLKKLELPERLTPNAMLEVLNLLLTADEWEKL